VLLDEVHRLPADSPELDGDDDVDARSALFVAALLGALGGAVPDPVTTWERTGQTF
jgi:hypothetical protein